MKKITLGFLLIINLLNLNAQAKKELNKFEKMLVATWKVDSISIPMNNLAPEYQALAKQKMQEILPNIELIISSDQKYSMKGWTGVKDGIWTISKDGQILSVKPLDDKPVEKTKVILLTDEKLILESLNDKAKSTKIYFYKIK